MTGPWLPGGGVLARPAQRKRKPRHCHRCRRGQRAGVLHAPAASRQLMHRCAVPVPADAVSFRLTAGVVSTLNSCLRRFVKSPTHAPDAGRLLQADSMMCIHSQGVAMNFSLRSAGIAGKGPL